MPFNGTVIKQASHHSTDMMGTIHFFHHEIDGQLSGEK
jgi:hypothetical protein